MRTLTGNLYGRSALEGRVPKMGFLDSKIKNINVVFDTFSEYLKSSSSSPEAYVVRIVSHSIVVF